MEEGVQWALEQRQAGHPVVTYCTHGHSRSAIMVCAILVAGGKYKGLQAAWGRVREVRPGVHPNKRQWAALECWYRQYHGGGGGGGGGSGRGDGGGHGEGRGDGRGGDAPTCDLEAQQPAAPPTPELRQ